MRSLAACLAVLFLVLGPGTPVHAGKPDKRMRPGHHRWEHWFAREIDRFLETRHAGLPLRALRDRHVPGPTCGFGAVGHDVAAVRQVVGALRGLATADAPEVRAATLLMLGRTRQQDVAPLLRERARTDPAPKVRMAAWLGLGLVAGPEDVAAMADAARDARQPEGVQGAAILALGLSLQGSARTHLIALSEGLAHSSNRPAIHTRQAVLHAWSLRSPLDGDVARVTAVLGAARAPDGVRAAAAQALGRWGQAAAVPALLEELEDDAVSVRQATVAALARCAASDDAAVRTALARRLTDDKRPVVQGHAAVALGELGGEEVPALLEPVFRGKDARLRPWAAIALGLGGSREHAEALTQALDEESDPSRKAAAALALSLLMARDALPALVKETGETGCPHQRGMGCLAVGILGEADAWPTLRGLLERTPDEGPRFHAGMALALLDPTRTRDLLRRIATEDSRAKARVEAVRVLGRIRDAATLPFLQSLALDRKAPPALRAAAIQAVGEIGEDTPSLRRRLVEGTHAGLRSSPLTDVLPLL